MTPRPNQDQQRTNLPEQILATAWKQIGKTGAASLSLRAIARELGITAPAIYNYFENRDALVTALIVDAFTSFGDSQMASLVGIPEHDYELRVYALGQAYRQWAVAHPERYQLIFGVPIAGYVAPMEITQPAASRSLASLLGVLSAAYTAGKLRSDAYPKASPRLQSMYQTWQDEGQSTNPHVFFLAILLWGQVHGLVSLEIGHQFPASVTDPGEIFTQVLNNHIRLLFNQS